MEYQEFLCAVEKKINKGLKGGITAGVHAAVKNNGKIKKGIVIENPAVNISPTIYLEEHYERFKKGESLDAIVCDLIEFYENIKYKESWDTSRVECYEKVRDKIVFKIIHTKENEELLKEVPHIDILDLSVVFYVLLEVKKDGTATMLIYNKHLELWGIEMETLFPLACENAQRLLPAKLFMMRELMEEMLTCEWKEPRDMLGIPVNIRQGREAETEGENKDAGGGDVMFVLTNSIRSFGAACMLYPEIMDKVGNILEESFYILPSSIHELIIVPRSKGLDKTEMEEVVREVNSTQVKEEERLSGRVYFYDVTKRKLLVL